MATKKDLLLTNTKQEIKKMMEELYVLLDDFIDYSWKVNAIYFEAPPGTVDLQGFYGGLQAVDEAGLNLLSGVKDLITPDVAYSGALELETESLKIEAKQQMRQIKSKNEAPNGSANLKNVYQYFERLMDAKVDVLHLEKQFAEWNFQTGEYLVDLKQKCDDLDVDRTEYWDMTWMLYHWMDVLETFLRKESYLGY